MSWSRPLSIYRASQTNRVVDSRFGLWPRRSDAPVQCPVAPRSHPALVTSRDSKVAITANTHVSQVMTGRAPASIRCCASPSPVSSRDVPGRENDDRARQVGVDQMCRCARSSLRSTKLLTPTYVTRDLLHVGASGRAPLLRLLARRSDRTRWSQRPVALRPSRPVSATRLKMTGRGQPASGQDVACVRSLLSPPFSFSKSTTTSLLLPIY
jgi:hypothetical protein